MSGEEHVYGLDEIREGDNKFPKWLLVVYALLTSWAIYYTVTYWTMPGDEKRQEVLNSSITYNNPREEGYISSSKETPKPEVATASAGNDEKLIAEGKATYEGNCAGCHGVAGDGAGPAAAALVPKPRNFVTWKMKYGDDDASLTKTLENGVKGTAMPPWKAALSPDQIKSVIAYIRTFKQ
jgi:mono/diheme cytochrome c family protein